MSDSLQGKLIISNNDDDGEFIYHYEIGAKVGGLALKWTSFTCGDEYEQPAPEMWRLLARSDRALMSFGDAYYGSHVDNAVASIIREGGDVKFTLYDARNSTLEFTVAADAAAPIFEDFARRIEAHKAGEAAPGK